MFIHSVLQCSCVANALSMTKMYVEDENLFNLSITSLCWLKQKDFVYITFPLSRQQEKNNLL